MTVDLSSLVSEMTYYVSSGMLTLLTHFKTELSDAAYSECE